MSRMRFVTRILAIVGFLALATALGSRPARLLAQAAGTQPIAANIGWDQETLNGLNAINKFRAQQQPPLAPLQIDATLQYAAAWEVNDGLTKGQCLTAPPGATVQWVLPNPSPQAVCPHTDSLGRDPGPRTAAFGYPRGGEENALFHGGDNAPDRLTQGQNAYQGWYDLEDPDPVTGLPTYAHRKGLINPNDTVIGLARQCDLFAHACFWVADFGPCLVMPFTPPSGPTPPTSTPTPPACQGAGPVTLPPATLQPPPVPSFAGTWVVDNFNAPTPAVNGLLTLTLNGNQATGTYSYASPDGCGTQSGTLTGTVSADKLTFNSNETGCNPSFNGGNGPLTNRLVADGQSFVGGFFWNGKRCGGAAPACPPALTTTQPTTTTTTTTPTNTTTQPPTTTTTTPPTTTTTTQPPTTTTTTTQPATTTAATGPGFAATWTVDNFNLGTDAPYGGNIKFSQTGDQVTGTYTYPDSSGCGTMSGNVTGTVSGNTLNFSTFESGCGQHDGTGGFGMLALSADSQSFAGTSFTGTSPWNGRRTGP